MGEGPEYWEFTLFATDPTGFEVVCSEERLDDIYHHHPELRNFWGGEGEMRQAIEDADVIFQSAKGPNFRVYYLRRRNNNAELKVAVKKREEETGELYAAQPCSKRPPGEIVLWKKPKT